MKTVGYIRVSTTGQVDDGASLQRQREAIENWAAMQGHELVGIYEDAGVSGSDFEREGLRQALEVAKQHKAILVSYDLARFGRGVMGVLGMAEELKEAGCQLACINDSIDTSSAMGRFVFTLLSALNEMERSLVCERTQRMHDHLKESGRVQGHAPKGYKVGEDKRLVKDDSESKAIAYAKRLYGQGESLRSISKRMADKGYLNRRGAPYNHKTVATMVR